MGELPEYPYKAAILCGVKKANDIFCFRLTWRPMKRLEMTKDENGQEMCSPRTEHCHSGKVSDEFEETRLSARNPVAPSPTICNRLKIARLFNTACLENCGAAVVAFDSVIPMRRTVKVETSPVVLSKHRRWCVSWQTHHLKHVGPPRRVHGVHGALSQ